MHKLTCIVLSAVVIALCRAIRVVCLHDVSVSLSALFTKYAMNAALT
jgi:hypothetical protein